MRAAIVDAPGRPPHYGELDSPTPGRDEVLGQVAAEHDLTLVQLRLLGILRDREPAMAELAERLGLDRSSVTGLVDRAERRGLVERRPSPVDGRGVRVRLTRQGRAQVGRGARQVEVALQTLVAPLTATECTTLARLATKVLGGRGRDHTGEST